MERLSSNGMINNLLQQKGRGFQHFLTYVSDDCIDVISNMLKYNPEERFSANQALRHPYFRDLFEQDCKISYDNNQIKSLKFNDSASLTFNREDSVMIYLDKPKGKVKRSESLSNHLTSD